MHPISRTIKAGSLVCAAAIIVLVLSGCNTEQVVVGTAVVTGVGSVVPSNEIEQIYYLGVFDPHEQIPPTIYRVRVRGQASSLSRTKFASGWVRSELIDSLGTQIAFNDKTRQLEFKKESDSTLDKLQTGRRLMLFGPEGFREAPKDHRLVIVMGQSPEDFFNAIDQSLGVISQAQAEQRNSNLNRLLFEALVHVENEQENLDRLENDIGTEFSEPKEVN